MQVKIYYYHILRPNYIFLHVYKIFVGIYYLQFASQVGCQVSYLPGIQHGIHQRPENSIWSWGEKSIEEKG